LISPCHCSGTQKYIHFKCLNDWIKVKLERNEDGVETFDTCELCQARFSVCPVNIRQDVGIGAWLRYKLLLLRNRIVQSPLGRGIRWFDTLMWLYSSGFACFRVVTSLPQLPKLLITSRTNLRALKPMITNLVSSMLMELSMSTYDFRFHLETALFYMIGWGMDASARSVAESMVPSLPPTLQSFARGALLIPQAIGLTVQAMDLSLIFILGGVSSAYLDGMVQMIALPLFCVSEVTRFATQHLRMISKFLSKSIHGAASAVFMVKA
jgi:hypothetical protein